MCPSSSPLSSGFHIPKLNVSDVFGSQNQLTTQPRILREKTVSPLQPSTSQYPLNADHRQRLGNLILINFHTSTYCLNTKHGCYAFIHVLIVDQRIVACTEAPLCSNIKSKQIRIINKSLSATASPIYSLICKQDFFFLF